MLDELQRNQIVQCIRDRQDVHLTDLLDAMAYNPRRVLELRYGLADGHHYSVEETASVFEKPIHWVTGMEGVALSELCNLYFSSDE